MSATGIVVVVCVVALAMIVTRHWARVRREAARMADQAVAAKDAAKEAVDSVSASVKK